MRNDTIKAEELANISSYQTLWGDKNWKSYLSNHEAQNKSGAIYGTIVVFLLSDVFKKLYLSDEI
jgi:hypothetical protein